MIGEMTPETFAGSPWEAEYKAVAPHPDNFPRLVEKLVALDTAPQDWPAEAIRGIAAPTLVISGDADIIRPEHSVEIFRLRGGGPSEDFMTAPAAELAILPGTTHLGVIEQPELVATVVEAFFDKPID
jgi:pimeloyl-ACP methyl ester carboxylesterase